MLFESKHSSQGILFGFGSLFVVFLYFLFLKQWRWGIYGLIAYMPFSGLPGILFYSSIGSGRASLIKDFLFVIPAYLGFTFWYLKNRKQTRLDFPGSPLILMVVLAGLLFFHFLAIMPTNLMVGLIGLKVWLFYMPLFFLGYHLIDSKTQLIRLAKLMLILGMIPVIFGIVQAGLIYSGNQSIAFMLHGPAANASTQGFALFLEAGGVGLSRVPGLFTFVSQYFLFLLCLLPIACATWLSADQSRRHMPLYTIVLTLVVIAAFTCGARAAYMLIPGYFGVIVIMDRRFRHLFKYLVAFMVVIPIGFNFLLWLIGTSRNTFLEFASDVILGYLSPSSEYSLIYQFKDALKMTWSGLGTGMATGSSRFAFQEYGIPASAGAISGIEAFYAKTIVEIGVPGLIIVVAIFTRLIFSGWINLKEIKESSLRAFSVSLLAFLILIVIYLLKGAAIDYDPLNVYFWFFAGILMKLPTLDLSKRADVVYGLQQ